MIMRRTTPVEPFEPVEPANPFSNLRQPAHLVPHDVAVGGRGNAFVFKTEGSIVVHKAILTGENDAPETHG